jgi:hypothetical protein
MFWISWICACFISTYCCTLASGNIPSIASITANIALVVILQITVRSKRSGKFLFKAYMLVIISSTIHTTENNIKQINGGGRKQSENEGFGCRPIAALSRHGTNGQIANGMTDVQRSQSATSNPVLSDDPAPVFNLEEISKIYSPLIDDAIRLLHIYPSGDETLGVEADLVHFPLLSARLKNYKALSYTWGVEKASVSIAINGASMLISPNLDKILREIRALEYEYVWVSSRGFQIFSSSRANSKFRLMLFAQISKTT